jgi:NAD(P)-dependent dehydrogenase (short-subunit alcohol dehydrogenase family)
VRPEREVVVFFAREPREVEDNDEMNLALVRPAVLEKPLQLRTVGGFCALPLVNLFGLIETIQAVLPGMRARRQGVIVNVSSVGGRMAYPLGTLYHGSKWAVEGLSEALHYELRPFGIAVRIVEPGGVRTDFGGRSFVFTHDPALTDYQPMVNAVTEASKAGTASGVQEPEEVAQVLFDAATDPNAPLRTISGDGARALLSMRYDPTQDEAFVAGLRARFGL